MHSHFCIGLKSDLKGFNIGVPKEYFTLGIDPKIENNVRESIKTLEELGANVEEVSLPHTKYAFGRKDCLPSHYTNRSP